MQYNLRRHLLRGRFNYFEASMPVCVVMCACMIHVFVPLSMSALSRACEFAGVRIRVRANLRASSREVDCPYAFFSGRRE